MIPHFCISIKVIRLIALDRTVKYQLLVRSAQDDVNILVLKCDLGPDIEMKVDFVFIDRLFVVFNAKILAF